MTMFIAEIAFLFELALIAWGLLILSKAETRDNKYRKWAAYILLIGSILTLLCTSFFSMKYMAQGGFDQALLGSLVVA